MLKQELIYSEERKTWNLFVNNEWYFEGTYEQCADMMTNNALYEDDNDYYGDDGDDYPDELDDYYRDIDLANEAMFAETMD